MSRYKGPQFSIHIIIFLNHVLNVVDVNGRAGRTGRIGLSIPHALCSKRSARCLHELGHKHYGTQHVMWKRIAFEFSWVISIFCMGLRDPVCHVSVEIHPETSNNKNNGRHIRNERKKIGITVNCLCSILIYGWNTCLVLGTFRSDTHIQSIEL